MPAGQCWTNTIWQFNLYALPGEIGVMSKFPERGIRMMQEKHSTNSDLIASYQGSARVRLRISTYHGKGSPSAEMQVYPELLVFSGAGWGRSQLQKYEISKEKIEKIVVSPPSEVPGFFQAFGVCRYGLRIISKPGGAFGDHDEYFFQFNEPSVSEVVNTLRSAGYPL